MVGACDVGLIFLDYRFTIPNFPSRLLSYMQAKIPVLAVTDPNTDIGKVIVSGGFGWWCESKGANAFAAKVIEAIEDNRRAEMSECAMNYLKKHYSSEESYRIIMR
jgi:glycosyltransferase involved in cell wall biosynthesis